MHDDQPQLRMKIMSQIFDQGPVAIVVTDADGVIEYVNPAFVKRTGYRYDEVVGQTPRILKSGHTQVGTYRDLWATISSGRVWRGEMINRAKDGTEFVESQVIAPILDDQGRVTHFVAIKEDVSPLKASDQALKRSNRMLQILSACNQSLVRSQSEQELLDKICRLLVDLGDYRLVWVGLAEDDEATRIRPLAVAGRDGDYLDQFCDQVRGKGLSGLALRQGRALIKHLAEEVDPLPCTEEALVRGYVTSIALPFRIEGVMKGVLRLYATDADHFDAEEVRLLEELAEDLGFGLTTQQTRRSLMESEGRFRTLAEDTIAGIYMIQNGGFAYVNPQLANIFGLSVEEMLGKTVMDVVAPEDQARVAENIRRRIDGEVRSIHYEFRGLRSDGQRIQVEVFGARTDHEGAPAVVGTLLDVTERKQTEERMRLLSRAVNASSSGIAISDLSHRDNPFVYVNKAFETITGYSAEEVLGRNGRFLLGRDRQQPEVEKLKAALSNRSHAEVVLRNYHHNGSLFWNRCSVAPVEDEQGETTHYISVFDDITEQKSYEQQLERLANYDNLTGMANKNLLHDRIQQAMIHAERGNHNCALLMLDIDRFKVVHQSLGVVGSDSVLQIVAQRMQEIAAPADTVARLGADEFAWLLHEVRDEGMVVWAAQRLMEIFEEPISVGPNGLTITASIGVALHPRDGRDSEALLCNAEAALVQAAKQRNCFRFYAPGMNEQARERLVVEMELKRALERDEFVLFYQPKLCLRTGRIVGAEALMRWQHPARGLVPPYLFIPAAEESGLINRMGRWALRIACQQVAELNSQLVEPLSIAVNLSAKQLGDDDLCGFLDSVLETSGLPADLLECELTESMLMSDPDDALRLLLQLKGLGVCIALDDFGTGYSSLSYLKRFPIDTLKVDRSFVSDIPDDQQDLAITRAIIALAQSLQLRVVAEGVETQEQRQFLADEGCDQMQGFLFSKPLPWNEFVALVEASNQTANRMANSG